MTEYDHPEGGCALCAAGESQQHNPEPMDAPRYHAWANGFGVWHVRVSRDVVSPLLLARRVLRDELTARHEDVRREVWLRPTRRPELDDDRTLVYQEGP